MTIKPNDGGRDISHLPPKKDSYLASPITLVVILFFFETGLYYEPTMSLLAFPIILVVPIIVVAFLYLGIKNIVHRRYKSAASLIVAIPILIFALGLPIRGGVIYAYAPKVASYIKLTLNEKQYLEEIKLVQPDINGFRYKELYWVMIGAETCKTLVYDDSDELRLPPNQRSKAWWRKVKPNSKFIFNIQLAEQKSYEVSVHKIKSHFYDVDYSC